MGTVNTKKTYDVMGRVISTATDIGTENITYDSAGRIAKKTNSVNGTEKIYSYYPNSLVKKIITKQNGTTVYNENYGYDTAAISQFLNAINPYEVTVDFYTTR